MRGKAEIMASISSAGIGSGLDVNGIVTQLMAIEKQPLTQMQSVAGKLNDKLSSYGKIQSYVSSLRDAASRLTAPANWAQTSAISADASVVSASTGSAATAGAYSIQVQGLASSQALSSGKFAASTTAVGSGTLHIEIGSWQTSPAGFTERVPAGAVTVTIDPGANSLGDIRDKINAAHGGVSATIVTDTGGARLVLRSTATGAENGFRVTATDDASASGSTGLGVLGYPPVDPLPSGFDAMALNQPAANASAKVNGLSVSSASNTFDQVIDNLTFKVNKVSASPVDVTVASDNTALKKLVTDFASAYNDLAKFFSDQTAYNATTKVAGALQGDTAVNSLSAQMRNIIGDTLGGAGAGAYTRMAQIGLNPQANGTLAVDTGKLDTALGKVGDVKALFMASDGDTPSSSGFAMRLRSWGDGLLGVQGAVTTRSDSLRRQLDSNSKSQDSFSHRMTTVEARMRAQYSALDTQMSKMNALQTYVTQQIAAYNKTSA
jgi:flagellar hook-associated protein 2